MSRLQLLRRQFAAGAEAMVAHSKCQVCIIGSGPAAHTAGADLHLCMQEISDAVEHDEGQVLWVRSIHGNKSLFHFIMRTPHCRDGITLRR